jgi:phage repressor protein C with HTH and peptisase S24 domain
MKLTGSLKNLADLHGGVGPLADKVGIKRNTFYTYANGEREPRASDILSIADKTDVSLDWLLRGVGPGPNDIFEIGNTKESITIPRYAIDAAAGDGAIALSQDVEDFFMVSRDWISRFAPAGARLGVIQARGDSMEPTINNADALIVCFDITKQNINEGGIFVFSDSHGIKVKRIQVLLDGRLRISSDNERYEPEYIDQEYADEHLTIHAKVLLKTGPL